MSSSVDATEVGSDVPEVVPGEDGADGALGTGELGTMTGACLVRWSVSGALLDEVCLVL